MAELSAIAVTPSDQHNSDNGVRLVNVKLKEVEIAEKLADTSISFGLCFETVEKDTGASTRVGVAQTTTVDEVGLAREYSDKAEGWT